MSGWVVTEYMQGGFFMAAWIIVFVVVNGG